MKFGVLGTGMVGEAIASKLLTLGHEVMMGSRTSDNEAAKEWRTQHGPRARTGTFAETAEFGEILFNCTQGIHSIEALRLAGEDNLEGKLLVDVANPLDFSNGMPPSLTVTNTDSLGEQIQRAFPKARVVKALNTMNCELMVNPKMIPGNHDAFICGNDELAKDQLTGLLCEGFGWNPDNVIDLGDITNARATEALLPIWVRLYGKLQHPHFNFHITQR